MSRPIDRLRMETASAHQRLEELPYARAVLDGTIALGQYTSFLRAVHVLYTGIEQVLEHSGDPELRAVFGRALERRGLIERDLAFLRADLHVADGPALQASVLAQKVRLAGLRDPRQLLGYAYVLEGAQLGGLVQKSALADRAELQRGGLSFLTGLGKDTQAGFDAFLQRLEGALTQEAALRSATVGALAAFEGFAAILEALAPTGDPRRWLVAELNRDAGTHAVPDDAREVRAALQAGEATWRRYAYYEARYGERGLRFTRSDSAWLVTLARQEAPYAARHVGWLARVLAARGMPRLLLEQHLIQLRDALSAALPERAASYALLAEVSGQLHDERTAAVAEPHWSRLVSAHGANLGTECAITPQEAATLLVAAVADERCDVAQAVTSLSSWLADEARFSADWVDAAHRTLAAARAL